MNEHVQALVSARAKAVAERRRVVEALTADHKRGHTEETLETFVKLQDTIEAIDRAVADEERMAKRDAVGTRPSVGFSGLQTSRNGISSVMQVIEPVSTPRHFPLPWLIEEHNQACFIVKDRSGQALGSFYFEEEAARRATAKLLTKGEARKLALTFTKLPDLLQTLRDVPTAAIRAICERVAEAQAALEEPVAGEQLNAGEVAIKLRALFSEPNLLRAMFDVGYSLNVDGKMKEAAN